MNTFRQHIPTFVYDGEPPHAYQFSTTEELLSLEVVQRYKREGFSHFAMRGHLLMAISDEGFHWWVVGSIADPATVDLPVWGGARYRARLPDGTITVLGKEVVSSCDDVLTLRDGTKAMDLR